MPAAAPELILLAPGLLGPWPRPLHAEIAAGLDTPALGRLAARSRTEAGAAGAAEPLALEALVLARLDAPRPDLLAAPVAPITLAGDGGTPGPEWVMRADPVHLRTDVGTAFLFDAGHLDLGAEESGALAAELNAHAAADGYRLEALRPDRWYVHLPERPALDLHPPSVVAGREVGPFLPAGDDGGLWRRRLNELQMLLHASPINAAREARGALPVNSLWLWGLGRLPARPAAPRCDTLWYDDPLAAGLGALGWVAARPLPEDLRALLAATAETRGARHLAVLAHCHGAVLSNDVGLWRDGVVTLERDWLAPALAALAAGRLSGLEVRPALRPEGAALRLSRGSLRRWWRRDRPLARILADSDLGWPEALG